MNSEPYKEPKKSAYSCELYNSEFEKQFMDELEKDPKVSKWTKNHNIRIPYVNIDGKVGHYNPDFLVEYVDGSQELVEIKGKNLLTEITKRKQKAAKEWCEKRGIKYRLIIL
jgi:hypothetical protein